jgi:hypothetical protein
MYVGIGSENNGDYLMTSSNAEIPADERATIFHEQYGNDVDAGADLAEIVVAAGDYLARIIGPEAVDAAMSRMISEVVVASGESVEQPDDWRTSLSQAAHNCYSEWPLGSRLHDLAAYAVYGIVLDGSDDAGSRSKALEQAINEAEDFLKATPVAEWGLSVKGDLHRLVRLAVNRWALDNGQSVEPAALAQFGGVSEGHIRNMMSGQKRAFTSMDGLIPAQEAHAWLSGRPEFWNSVWREQSLPQYAQKHRPALAKAVFVPVARDGSIFHPGLKRGGGYTIGEKGSETQIADFDEALSELQRMPIPYWRRPNASGNWGTVSGIRWARLDVSDLEIVATNPEYKILEGDRV